jgi:hypothetical protein
MSIERRYAMGLSELLKRQAYLSGVSVRLKILGRGAKFVELGIRFTQETEYLKRVLGLGEELSLLLSAENCRVFREGGWITFQFSLPSQYHLTYTHDTIKELSLPVDTVGIGSRNKPVRSSLSKEPLPHTAFFGGMQTGKSQGMLNEVVTLASNYDPGQLGIIICDPNNEFDALDNLAHLKAPIARSDKEIQGLLQFTHDEFIYRARNDIRDASHLLLVMDEANSKAILGIKKVVNQPNQDLVREIFTQGHKYRINAMLTAQSANKTDWPDIFANIFRRFVGLVDGWQTSNLFTFEAGQEAHKLLGNGDFFHCLSFRGTNCTERVQLIKTSQSDFDKLPRREIEPLELIENDDFEIRESGKVGRPSLVLDEKLLALYMATPGLGRGKAKDLFNISQASHTLHSKQAKGIVQTVKDIKTAKSLGEVKNILAYEKLEERTIYVEGSWLL